MIERVLAVSTSASKLLTCGLQCSLRILKLARKLLDPPIRHLENAVELVPLDLKLAHTRLSSSHLVLEFEDTLVCHGHYLSHAPPCSQDTQVGPLDLDFRELLGDTAPYPHQQPHRDVGQPDEDADDEKRRRHEFDGERAPDHAACKLLQPNHANCSCSMLSGGASVSRSPSTQQSRSNRPRRCPTLRTCLGSLNRDGIRMPAPVSFERMLRTASGLRSAWPAP